MNDDPLYQLVDGQIEHFRSAIEEDTEIDGAGLVDVFVGFLRELAELRGRPYQDRTEDEHDD